MSTLVIGANGGVGKYLIQQLQNAGETFTAGVRKEEQINDLQGKGIDAKLIDVENDSIETLTDKFKGFDQVVFSVGSGGNTGADKTIIVDLDGAVKTIEASKANHVSKYVMVSTYDSRREAFDESGALKPYTIAKHYADEHLKRSGLNYVIVHPGGLLDEAGTGRVDSAAFFDGKGTIPREDVASVISQVLTTTGFDNSEFQIISGTEELTTAINKFK